MNSSNTTMSTETTQKMKGNRQDVCSFFIPFYSEEYFSDEKIEKQHVQLPVMIEHEKGEVRSNVTKLQVPEIQHFDGNIEHVLSTIKTIYDRVVKPRKFEVRGKQFMFFVSMLKLVAPSEPAISTIDRAIVKARVNVMEHEGDKIVIDKKAMSFSDEETYFKGILADVKNYPLTKDDLEARSCKDIAEYQAHLYYLYVTV